MHCIVSIEVIFDRRPQKEVNRRAEGACQLLILRNTFKHIKGVRKKWIFFYGQADHEGEGASPIGPDCKQM